jgi:hypothetical protein
LLAVIGETTNDGEADEGTDEERTEALIEIDEHLKKSEELMQRLFDLSLVVPPQLSEVAKQLSGAVYESRILVSAFRQQVATEPGVWRIGTEWEPCYQQFTEIYARFLKAAHAELGII